MQNKLLIVCRECKTAIVSDTSSTGFCFFCGSAVGTYRNINIDSFLNKLLNFKTLNLEKVR
jgi:hypothetical protein